MTTTSDRLMGAMASDLPIRSRLAHPGARRWYGGALFGLAYQAIELVAIWTTPAAPFPKVVATGCLAVFYLLYFLIPPLVWPERDRVRIAATLGLLLVSFLLFVPVGLTTVWTWPLIAVIAAFTWSSQIAGYSLVVGLGLASLAIAAANGWPDSISASPYITGSVGVLMVAFGAQVRQTVQLRAANDAIARLAVDEERARFARDLHDSLGHSLTVVAVKSELAGKLLDRDPAAAGTEIAAIEQLTRQALADLRASVGGVHAVTLEGELAAANEALAAAGVAVRMPGSAAAVRPELRPLFAWAVREGATNVLRHAHASTCSIALTRTSLVMRNDGAAKPDPASGGHGLRGLAERAAALGARVDAHLDPAGGFELRVGR